MTYDCEICGSVNHTKHLHCSSCGTIPSRYSVTRKPVRELIEQAHTRYIEVCRAIGSERLDRFRTTKHELRTVPGDYYAEV